MVSCVARLRDIFDEADKNLSQLDRLILDVIRGFGISVLSTMLSAIGRTKSGGTPRKIGIDTVLGHVKFTCLYHAPDPGAPMSRQDQRRRKREKAKGQRRIKNGTFARMGGAQCAFPFKEELRLLDGMTPALATLHNRVAVFSGSFREGADTLRHLAGVVMSESTFMRRAYAAGKRAEFEQDLEVMRQVVSGALPFHLTQALIAVVPTLYIMLDGTGVPCVKKDTRGRVGKNGKPAGTREIKVGVIGTFRWKDARGRPVRDPRGETYIATDKEAQSFGAMLRRVANSRGYGGKFRIQICGDGAEWIAKIVEKAFPGQEVIFVNDFYHACEHLHDFLAYALKEKKVSRKIYTKARGILKRNGGHGLITHLERVYGKAIQDNEDATKELNYFTKRIENMKYPEYRKQGLYIGSGIIEATCRTVVARRCKQAGMHWRLKNAAAMCALVAKYRSAIPADKPAA